LSKLAALGGKPITRALVSRRALPSSAALERKYLLEAYDSDEWDDWPGARSMAADLTREWAAFCKSRFCALVTNGTHALQLALECLDIGCGDEVIVPGLTWQATASAVCDINAVPVLVDIDPTTLCIDPSKIEAAITPRTRAIIPVHLYHRLADMDRIQAIAEKHHLIVIEDCAHVHGSEWQGRGAGTLGTFGTHSFQRSKLMTAGEGGALLMQDEELHWRIVSQRACGREFRAGVKVHSGNYRITSFQAAVLRGQLSALRRQVAILDRTGRALDAAVAAAPGVEPLRRHPGITRQCSYAFAFLYHPEKFDGLPGEVFRKALGAELGFTFGTTYTPLSHSEAYFPETKKRHRLSREYLEAITPSRWQLPNADDCWKNRAVLARWTFFGCPPSRTRLLTQAIEKIHEHRHELLAQG
jgi:dTDP-4-amino-4,6-dideoxygalactose transaminase